ncbi:cupin domain-containing protein [Microbispora sp. H10885]|uniref:cupin domain-containing protein n=1 Tax=Microbispora sp. H10885 TaxID=2729110 RepID=UPI0015FFE4FD|nr:cupin domain-containing protein [Microbispora sp. H10885]
MSVIHSADSRRSTTPNGVMTTLASPTQGGAAHAVWRVDMPAGNSGPLHSCDREQVWTFLSGGATVDLDGETYGVEAGDTIVLPADLSRRVHSDAESGFSAIAVAPAGAEVYIPGGVTAEDACDLAPKGTDRIVPPWMR